MLHLHRDHSVRRRVATYRPVRSLAVRARGSPASQQRRRLNVGELLWYILGGFWLALVHLITGIFLCLTIIGIPLGIANFKLINVSMRPFGRDIVSADEARRRRSAGVIF